MLSFIYFILAFHLRKEFLHTPHHPPFCIISPHPTLCIWKIKIFSRPDIGVLNGFLQSFDHSQEEARPGVLLGTSGVGGALYTPQGGNTPVHDIAIFLRTGSISFSLQHFTPCQVHSSLDRALKELNISPVIKDALAWSFNDHVIAQIDIQFLFGH